jgi:hypothetical protein
MDGIADEHETVLPPDPPGMREIVEGGTTEQSPEHIP